MELLSYIIDKNAWYITEILYEITSNGNVCFFHPFELDIFKLLLDKGLPIDGYLHVKRGCDKKYTPLILSVIGNKIDFISLLLDRGANIHKESVSLLFQRETPLMYAVSTTNVVVTKLLLERGAGEKINEQPALLKICMKDSMKDDFCFKDEAEIIELLLENGAELSISNERGITPLKIASTKKKGIIIKKIAMLRFENQLICLENVKYLQERSELNEKFEECLSELQWMKDYEVYNGYSLLNIIQMRKQHKKLTLLTKNQDFIAAFELFRNKNPLEYYDIDLDNIVENALQRRDAVMSDETKLKPISKKYNLPQLVIEKIAYFANEHLFFK